jgi:hypothetical protein
LTNASVGPDPRRWFSISAMLVGHPVVASVSRLATG